MSSYSKQFTISTFHVDKLLIENLETYFNKEIIEILKFNSKEGSNLHKSTSILLHDSHGQETYTSIKEYRLPMFRDDLKGITLDFTIITEKKDLRILLRFGSEGENSDLAITLTDENAREKVSAIEHGVLSVLNPNKTLNWLLFPNQIIGLVLIIITLGAPILALDGDTSKKGKFIYFTVFCCAILYFWGFSYLKGYCSFDTNKQKRFNQWFNWLIMGVIGFLLFNTALPSIRKTIFGF